MNSFCTCFWVELHWAFGGPPPPLFLPLFGSISLKQILFAVSPCCASESCCCFLALIVYWYFYTYSVFDLLYNLRETFCMIVFLWKHVKHFLMCLFVWYVICFCPWRRIVRLHLLSMSGGRSSTRSYCNHVRDHIRALYEHFTDALKAKLERLIRVKWNERSHVVTHVWYLVMTGSSHRVIWVCLTSAALQVLAGCLFPVVMLS